MNLDYFNECLDEVNEKHIKYYEACSDWRNSRSKVGKAELDRLWAKVEQARKIANDSNSNLRRAARICKIKIDKSYAMDFGD